MGRGNFGLVAVLLLFLSGLSSGALVRVDSDPPGLDAWAAQRYLGRTPLTAQLPAGRVTLRLAEAVGSIYRTPVVDTVLDLRGQEALDLFFRIGRLVSVRSEPFGIPLLRNGVRIGETPLEIRLDSSRQERLTLLVPSGPITVPADSLLAEGRWIWRGETPRIGPLTPGQRPLWRKVGRYLMPAVAGALIAAGMLVEERADRAYDRYLDSADPGEIERHYDRARRWDAWAAALWVGAEISIGGAIVAWILPEREPDRRMEGER